MKALIYSEWLRLKSVTLRALGLNALALMILPSLFATGDGLFLLTLIYALATTMMAMHHANALTQASERAFLIHRPVKLNTIVHSVVLAGLLCVLVAFLLPFFVYVVLSQQMDGGFTGDYVAVLSVSVIVCFCCYLAGLVKQHCSVWVGWLICALPLLMFALSDIHPLAFILLFAVLLMLYQRLFGFIESKPSRLMGLPLIVALFIVLSNVIALSWQMAIVVFDDDYKNNWVAYYPKHSINQLMRLHPKPRMEALFALAEVKLPNNVDDIIVLIPNRNEVGAHKRERLTLSDDVLTVEFSAKQKPIEITLKATAGKIASVSVVHTSLSKFVAVIYKPQILTEKGLPFFELIEYQHNQKQLQRKVIEVAYGWQDAYRLRNYIISPLLAGVNTLLVERNPNQFATFGGAVLWLMVAGSVVSLLITWRLNQIIGLPTRQQQGWLVVNMLTGICGLLSFVMIYYARIKPKPALLDSS